MKIKTKPKVKRLVSRKSGQRFPVINLCGKRVGSFTTLEDRDYFLVNIGL